MRLTQTAGLATILATGPEGQQDRSIRDYFLAQSSGGCRYVVRQSSHQSGSVSSRRTTSAASDLLHDPRQLFITGCRADRLVAGSGIQADPSASIIRETVSVARRRHSSAVSLTPTTTPTSSEGGHLTQVARISPGHALHSPLIVLTVGAPPTIQVKQRRLDHWNDLVTHSLLATCPPSLSSGVMTSPILPTSPGQHN